MRKKLILAILAIACTLCCMFGLIACGETHDHTFSESWTYDEDFHWHAATCEHKSEVKDRAPHVMANGVCTVCGYEDDGDETKVYRTVTFNLNGGDGSINDMQFVVGKVMSDLPVPTRSGYTFICWQELLGDDLTAASVMPDRNVTLVAKWEKVLTSYSDQYVSFKPATDGYKSSYIYMEYNGEVDKFVYVEITSDDLGGVEQVGQNNNFNLRTMDGTEYKVNSGYTWAWFQGSFDVPNGAQRFTLNYGSNVQFVTISDADGVVQQTYLVDLYVMHDYYVNLYTSIYETEPYESVRIVENERFSEFYAAPDNKFEADVRLYYNSETGNYENFVYSTAITKNWNLYQTYKPYTLEAELDGAMLEGELKITPYTIGYTLPVPVKEGYDFLGWKNSAGKYVTDANGNGGEKYLAEKADSTKPAAITVTGKLIASFETSNKFYDSDCDGVTTFDAIRSLTYTDIYQTVISKTTFSAESGHKITSGTQRVPVGSEITVTASKLGHTFNGWYDGDTKLSDDAEYKFEMPFRNIQYTVKYEVDAELSPFEFKATADTLTITGIKDKTVTEITVPDYTTNIAFGAFRGCENVESITLPFVGESCSGKEYTNFGYIFGTSDYTQHNSYVPENLKTVILTAANLIDKYAFANCENITSITIPDCVDFIYTYAFLNCDNLNEIYITDLEAWCKIGSSENVYNAFIFNPYDLYLDGELLTELVIPDGITSIERKFSFCRSIVSVNIPESVTSIGNNAFTNCSNLISVSIPESVTTIGSQAFSGCPSLTNVNLPGNITNIGSEAFRNCLSLTDVTIPENVTTIEQYAYEGCVSLTSITIPAKVKNINTYAFHDCNKLVEVYNLSSLNILKGSTNYGYVAYYALAVYNSLDGENHFKTTDDGCIFYADGNEVYLIEYTGTETELDLPENFNGKNYAINQRAFENCSELKSVIIPDGVTSIGAKAFIGCDSLESITIPFVGASVNALSLTASTLFGYIFGSGVPTVQSFGFGNEYTVTNYIPESLKNVVVTGGNILYGAFSNCSNLVSVTLINGNSVSIGSSAFYCCTSLKSVTLPDNVTSIGSSAFYRCTSLISITIPEKVTTIGSNAFESCTALTEVNYNAVNCKLQISSNSQNFVFSYAGISGEGITLKIGANVISVPNNLFCPNYQVSFGVMKDVPNLVTVIFEENNQCTSIGNYAFYVDSSLKSIFYSGTAEEWGQITISGNAYRKNYATLYFYSENEPSLDTEGTAYDNNYWHYGDDGKTPVIWLKEN